MQTVTQNTLESMKISFRYILLASIVLLAATACEEIIELEGESVEPKMIIQSVCTNEDKIVIAVSSSGTIYDTPDTGEVFNPIVKVSINGGEPKECIREYGASPYDLPNRSSPIYADYRLKEPYYDGYVHKRKFDSIIPIGFERFTRTPDDIIYTYDYYPSELDIIEIFVEDPKSNTKLEAQTQIPRKVKFDIELIKVDTVLYNVFDHGMNLKGLTATFQCTIHDPKQENNFYMLEFLDRSGGLWHFLATLQHLENPKYPDWYTVAKPLPIHTKDKLFYDPNIPVNNYYYSDGYYYNIGENRTIYFTDDTVNEEPLSFVFRLGASAIVQIYSYWEENIFMNTNLIDGLFKLHSMSEEMYRYCKSKEYSQQYNQDIFSQPNQLYSNIKGDAYGFHISESYSYSEPIMIGFEEIAGYFE